MTPSFRFGIVGFGRIAGAHAQAIAGRTDVSLSLGLEPSEAAAEAARAQGIEVLPSLSAMVERAGELDGVLVTTPPHLRREVLLPLMDAGLPVLVEKPLALDSAEAAYLIAAARERGLVLQTAAKFPAMPSMATARARIDAGGIGQLEHIDNVFSGVLDVTGDWRSQPAVGGGGVWMDNGPHSVDVVRALGGEIASVTVRTWDKAQGTPVEDDVEVDLALASGATARIGLTWNRQAPAPIAVVRGTAGSLVVGWKALELVRGESTEVLGGGYDKVGAFAAIHDRFVMAVRAEAAPCDAGYRGLLVIEAGYRSAKSGQTEQVAQ
jgi:predicted dehydrogenase